MNPAPSPASVPVSDGSESARIAGLTPDFVAVARDDLAAIVRLAERLAVGRWDHLPSSEADAFMRIRRNLQSATADDEHYELDTTLACACGEPWICPEWIKAVIANV